MAHSVGEQAARAVKNSERKKVLETRSAEDIIKGIRGNLKAHLAVTPSDTAFLLKIYDETLASLGVANLDVEQKDDAIADLQEKLDRFREVYEQENRTVRLAVAQIDGGEHIVALGTSEAVGIGE